MTHYIPVILVWAIFAAGAFGWRRTVEQNRALRRQVFQLEIQLQGRVNLHMQLFKVPRVTGKDLED